MNDNWWNMLAAIFILIVCVVVVSILLSVLVVEPLQRRKFNKEMIHLHGLIMDDPNSDPALVKASEEVRQLIKLDNRVRARLSPFRYLRRN